MQPDSIGRTGGQRSRFRTDRGRALAKSEAAAGPQLQGADRRGAVLDHQDPGVTAGRRRRFDQRSNREVVGGRHGLLKIGGRGGGQLGRGCSRHWHRRVQRNRARDFVDTGGGVGQAAVLEGDAFERGAHRRNPFHREVQQRVGTVGDDRVAGGRDIAGRRCGYVVHPRGDIEPVAAQRVSDGACSGIDRDRCPDYGFAGHLI